MIVDVNTYLGHWPFRNIRHNTANELSTIGEKNGITHMIVSSLNAIFYKDCMQGNLELHKELKAYNGNTVFLPFAVINPTYPAWEKDLKSAVKDYGFKGVELCPIYHGYSLLPSDDETRLVNPAADVFQLAGELGLPVRITAGFENFRQRHHMDVQAAPTADEILTLIKSSDKTTVILNGFLPFTLGKEMYELLRDRKNIFFDTTALDTFLHGSLEKAIAFIGEDHLCFGTMAPMQYPQANLAKIIFTRELNKENVLYKNIANYLISI